MRPPNGSCGRLPPWRSDSRRTGRQRKAKSTGLAVLLLFCLTYQTAGLYLELSMEVWKEFEANELTHSAAHHLLAIHELGLEYGGWARVSDIARQLGITRGSVSINLRALKKRGLVATDEHRMVKLSPKGLKIAQGVMAKKA